MCAALDEYPHSFCMSERNREYERRVPFVVATVQVDPFPRDPILQIVGHADRSTAGSAAAGNGEKQLRFTFVGAREGEAFRVVGVLGGREEGVERERDEPFEEVRVAGRGGAEVDGGEEDSLLLGRERRRVGQVLREVGRRSGGAGDDSVPLLGRGLQTFPGNAHGGFGSSVSAIWPSLVEVIVMVPDIDDPEGAGGAGGRSSACAIPCTRKRAF